MTGKRGREKARNKIGPQGFDNIGNREIEEFRGIENQNVFKGLARGHAKPKRFASEIFASPGEGDLRFRCERCAFHFRHVRPRTGPGD
jgi:hypothetical protein